MIATSIRNCILPTAVMLGLTSMAQAQDKVVCFPNTTIIKSAVIGKAIVGYAQESDINDRKNPTNPTIDLIDGGSITGDLTVSSNSTVFVSGGSIGGDLLANDRGQATISGGTIKGDLLAYNQSAITLQGGTIGKDVVVYHHSTLNLRGGSIGGKLFIKNSGTLNLFGTHLLSKFKQTRGLSNGFYREYSLSGQLEDGTSLENKLLLVESNNLESVDHPQFTLHNTMAHTTVLPPSEGTFFFPKGTQYWTPKPADIARLEADLPRLAKDSPSPRPHRHAAPQGILTYYRQYIGVIQGGRRVIYVNAFHPSLASEFGNWQQKAAQVMDGGTNFYHVTYDVEARRFDALQFNGYA